MAEHLCGYVDDEWRRHLATLEVTITPLDPDPHTMQVEPPFVLYVCDRHYRQAVDVADAIAAPMTSDRL